eukprot:COSAG05_NODE_27_length_29281_cov_199.946919_18_plen_85_part_00
MAGPAAAAAGGRARQHDAAADMTASVVMRTLLAVGTGRTTTIVGHMSSALITIVAVAVHGRASGQGSVRTKNVHHMLLLPPSYC